MIRKILEELRDSEISVKTDRSSKAREERIDQALLLIEAEFNGRRIGGLMQKVDNREGLPIITDDSHIVSAYIVVGCLVLVVLLLAGVWLWGLR